MFANSADAHLSAIATLVCSEDKSRYLNKRKSGKIVRERERERVVIRKAA